MDCALGVGIPSVGIMTSMGVVCSELSCISSILQMRLVDLSTPFKLDNTILVVCSSEKVSNSSTLLATLFPDPESKIATTS